MATHRIEQTYVEVVILATIPVRVEQTYVEVVILAPTGGGWGVGMVRMGPN